MWTRALALTLASMAAVSSAEKTLVGDLSELQYEVSGKVFILDDTRIMIEDFNYNGKGPDAFFYVGKSGSPSKTGYRVPYPKGDNDDTVLPKFTKQDVTIELQNGWKTSELKWLSVWCRQFEVNFGDVTFPDPPPKPTLVGSLSELQYEVSGKVYIIDETKILIEDFNYNGKGPDAFFYVGKSGSPSKTGYRVPYPKGDTKDTVLPKFTKQDVTIELQNGWKTSEVKWLSVWCRQFEVNFGDVSFIDPPNPAPTPAPPPNSNPAPSTAKKTLVGSLSELQYEVSGKVYILDDKKILIEDFNYNGKGPDAFFYVGKSGEPSKDGYLVPYPKGDTTGAILQKFTKEDVTIELQNGWKTSDLKWLSVWCRKFEINFGSVMFCKDDLPCGGAPAPAGSSLALLLLLPAAAIALAML